MKNNRAQLVPEEVIKIIVALIGVGILAILIFSLWNARVNNNELVQAKSTLEHLIINLREEIEEIEIVGPTSWGIVSYSATKDSKLPELCLIGNWENCICMCKNAPNIHTPKPTCLVAGSNVITCIESDFSIEVGITNPPVILKVDYANREITK